VRCPRRAEGSIALLARGAVLLALTLAIALPADAQQRTLYKWTDRDGKVQYSDKPPTGFTGEIERLEIDPALNATPGLRAPEAAAPKPAPSDIASKRRALRERLRAALDGALAKLELAKASLAVAGNCCPIKQDGGVVFLCPTLVPNESYYERLGKLEGAVRDAEAEVAAAEEAYRRGVD